MRGHRDPLRGLRLLYFVVAKGHNNRKVTDSGLDLVEVPGYKMCYPTYAAAAHHAVTAAAATARPGVRGVAKDAFTELPWLLGAPIAAAGPRLQRRGTIHFILA